MSDAEEDSEDFWEESMPWLLGIVLALVAITAAAFAGAGWLDSHFGWHLTAWLHALLKMGP
ncbi:hypothetical protein GCM10025867_47450 (plasmid) [Frondihabitans sucicola]|uniref:Uncharacterized protein n=1 Tax=Frondihabitans sucicola TaxID=1268041 RepID=A0ABN6Y5E6_9MICO|nr:hypothetical protein [Frondihabitans sucicola]BDZ52504.1 hypothetical protein GCM10025867_47450 [Frondihabitans sucicola]